MTSGHQEKAHSDQRSYSRGTEEERSERRGKDQSRGSRRGNGRSCPSRHYDRTRTSPPREGASSSSADRPSSSGERSESYRRGKKWSPYLAKDIHHGGKGRQESLSSTSSKLYRVAFTCRTLQQLCKGNPPQGGPPVPCADLEGKGLDPPPRVPACPGGSYLKATKPTSNYAQP